MHCSGHRLEVLGPPDPLIVAVVNQALLVIGGGSKRSVSRLQHIQETLQRTSRIRDSEGLLARLIRLGAGVPGLTPRIERIGTFKFAAQLAARFRADRVFLADDAAHRVTPRGGTGMNTAIADGYDLGWKLAWVMRGFKPVRPTHVALFDLEHRRSVRWIDLEPAGMGAVFRVDLPL